MISSDFMARMLSFRKDDSVDEEQGGITRRT